MINSYSLENYGPIRNAACHTAGRINLFIGPNRSGKTILLKALYTAIKTIEQNGRGKELRKDHDILFEKLYWTFQVDPLGKLVHNGAKSLKFQMNLGENQHFHYSFGNSTERQVKDVDNTCKPRKMDSIFLPAKEIVSIQDIILGSREVDKVFGFDETYYDLAKSLRKQTVKGRNYPEFSESRRMLETALGGHLEYESKSREWQFKEGNRTFSIMATSEGTKKMSILNTLLGNHYLKKGAIVFIDEPEAALHPHLVSQFMDIIELLTHAGLQFFIATHSYFVIKKLYLIAHQKRMSIPVLSFGQDAGTDYGDMQDGMPENAIIDESVALYREEITL